MTVLVLDRPRHADLIAQCRALGVRIRLISDGDVGGAIEVASDDAPVDIMLGIGGTPEGVIAGAFAAVVAVVRGAGVGPFCPPFFPSSRGIADFSAPPPAPNPNNPSSPRARRSGGAEVHGRPL